MAAITKCVAVNDVSAAAGFMKPAALRGGHVVAIMWWSSCGGHYEVCHGYRAAKTVTPLTAARD